MTFVEFHSSAFFFFGLFWFVDVRYARIKVFALVYLVTFLINQTEKFAQPNKRRMEPSPEAQPNLICTFQAMRETKNCMHGIYGNRQNDYVCTDSFGWARVICCHVFVEKVRENGEKWLAYTHNTNLTDKPSLLK